MCHKWPTVSSATSIHAGCSLAGHTTNGAKLRKPPVGKRLHEPSGTSTNANASDGPGTQHQAPGQSRNYAPNGLPRDQTNGAKLREPPAGKRPREPTRTSRNADASNGPGTQHQALDQSRSYAPNGPPQHAAIRQASQPGSQASQGRKPPEEPGQRATTTTPAAKSTLFFCATNRRNPSANLMRSPWWRALSQITLPCALKRHATVLRDHTTMCCVYVRHK